MYTRLNAVADAENRAEAEAFHDRLRYQKFMAEAERFAAVNGLVVGGAAATRLLLGSAEDPARPPEVALDSFQYDFYSGAAPTQARALSDAMYALDPDGLGHYTVMLTKVTGYLFTVQVDGREMFTVVSLPQYRGVRTADIIIPSERPAQFARDERGAPLRVQCLGPEIQLINIYSTLCNPAKAPQWPDLLAAEMNLRKLFDKEIRSKITTTLSRVEGGATHRAGRFARLILDEFAGGAGRVLVGEAGFQRLAGEAVSTDRVQIVTATALEAEAKDIVELGRRAGFSVTWRVDDPKVPTEPRLRRMTVHVDAEGRREPVCDVYNAAAFELVPYVVGRGARGGRRGRGRDGAAPGDGAARGVKVGTPFVLMRFRLVDMWTIMVLMHMGAIDVGYAERVLLGMLDGYGRMAAFYEALLSGGDPPAWLLPQSDYAGRLEDPELALKREAATKASGKFYPPYYPAAGRAGRA